METQLFFKNKSPKTSLELSGSKSISNRLLILQAFFPKLQIQNLSNSGDTRVLQKTLKSRESIIDIGHAGTAMRFLTAYFSFLEEREVLLTGSSRMKERPIGILVEALQSLGADITYEKKEGFPPVKIKGKKPTRKHATLESHVSSQYISALMLVAPAFPQGLEIELKNQPTSFPYIQMTAALLGKLGVDCVFKDNKIIVPSCFSLPKHPIYVEPDWSAASYFYSLTALSDAAKIHLKGMEKNSIQGDAVLPEIYAKLGVKTQFSPRGLLLKKTGTPLPECIEMDLSDTPDLAQTLVVSCLGLGVKCKLSGLHTLKIKETDRLEALKNELGKFGAEVLLTENSLEMHPPRLPKKNISVETYEDHRMAMAFAPLAIKIPIGIKKPEVVVKSYPDFWKDFKKTGMERS